eukprot:CAMPEP_0173413846 /NCGR_PEP_ID=MMETSP1356-20130122/83005_1 /TAXON_ID=77927 ORGANISM="Hemiselmis virescens, Strain PCC157" /NCGR_SAMPLE_ID=MMETSP1356 /ASSEMBLY_ACC=CAM_ASM_000847 /LENGTH=234 /DNA_ID=CAMNT_0014375939 /DNA_START=67 /DNA_END=771 /DNA_ORIENTATION=+
MAPEHVGHTATNPSIYPLFPDIEHWYLPGLRDPKSLVTSLNQLYAQAAIANLLVIERVKVWAEQSSGMVKLTSKMSGGGEAENRRVKFVKWSNAKNDPALMKRVHWTPLKRQNRAIEKLLRSYGMFPSRLLDISRNFLVFKDIKDLAKCFDIIAADENVQINRVKNRMSASYNSSESGGYRDVCINLSVVNKEAEFLGCELHICEIQLLLEEFAQIKTADGHKRYVQARNSRGV